MTHDLLNHYLLPGLPVVACEYPHHPNDAHTARGKRAVLANLGVSYVLDLTEARDRLEPWPNDASFAPVRARFPIPDGGVPNSLQAFDALIEELVDRVERGDTVAVHCWGGIGRTGVVCAALLVRVGWPVEDALAEVHRLWRTVPKASHPHHASRTAPETDAQRDFVRTWARAVSSRAPRSVGAAVSSRVARACLLGGALGDALGAAVEFLSLDQIRARYGPAGVRRPMPAYAHACPITDDTQMTLFTAEGMLRALSRVQRSGAGERASWGVSDDLFVEAIGDAYVRWLHTQAPASVPASHRALAEPRGWLLAQPSLHSQRAPGNTCLSALRQFVTSDVPPRVARNQSKGCGTVMRVAPIGLVAATPQDAFALAAATSALTHGHDTGIVAGGAFAVLVQQRARGVPLVEAIAVARACCTSHEGHEQTVRALDAAVQVATARGDALDAHDLLTLGEGWVAEEALATAVACAWAQPESFVDATCLAANLVRGDSDSTASMTGQLVALGVGLERLPTQWLEVLELREVITQVADDLAIGWRAGAAWAARWPG